MNKFTKLFTICAVMFAFFTVQTVMAKDFESIIKKSPLDETATVSVSIKNAKNGKILYEYNQNKYLHPASSLKLFMMAAAYDQLGGDFQYRTQLFKDKNNNIYLKLSGDPTLTTADLTKLFKELQSKYKFQVKDVVVDATVFDSSQWGTGWMWDDDTSKYLPKYSPFTINGNIINISVKPSKNNAFPEIKNKSNYQFTLVNLLKNGDKNDIQVVRQPWVQSDMTYLKGTIKTPVTIQLPVNQLERNFKTCLQEALKSAKVTPKGAIKVAPMQEHTELILEHVSKPLDTMISTVLKDSNNLYTEMILKTMGAKFTDGQGTTAAGIDFFNNYYKDVDSKTKPSIVDGGGASRNDLITADWMTSALNKIYSRDNFEDFGALMAKPVEGTLSDRMLNISQSVRAKTGTISGVSVLTGYVNSKSNEKYSFAILIQNYPGDSVEAKKLEDAIVTEIYNR